METRQGSRVKEVSDTEFSLVNGVGLPVLGLRIDSQTVLDYLTAHPTLSHVPIVHRDFGHALPT